MAEAEHSGLPKSNADAVAGRLIAETFDLDGEGLVALLRTLLTRAEQIKTLQERAENIEERLNPEQVSEQQEFNAEVLDSIYEPLCLKWMLSRVMKGLAQQLEYEVCQHQGHLLPIQQITFTDEGDVESFRLAPPCS